MKHSRYIFSILAALLIAIGCGKTNLPMQPEEVGEEERAQRAAKLSIPQQADEYATTGTITDIGFCVADVTKEKVDLEWDISGYGTKVFDGFLKNTDGSYKMDADGNIEVNWILTNFASGVKLHRRLLEDVDSPDMETESVDDFTILGIIGGRGKTDHTDHDVLPGRSYRYVIEFIDEAEATVREDSLLVAIPDITISDLSAPPNVSFTWQELYTGSQTGQIRLDWDRVQWARAYIVEREIDETPTKVDIFSMDVWKLPKTSWFKNSVRRNAYYKMRVGTCLNENCEPSGNALSSGTDVLYSGWRTVGRP